MNIGLIGAGANTRQKHIPGFRAIPGVAITAVVNRSRASSERVATEFGIPHVFDSVAELLADPGIDAVCVGTWPYRHRDYAVAALEAGKHVLCEARMAADLAEAEEMQRVAETYPQLVAQLVPAPFDFRLGPTVQRLLREGALGEMLDVDVAVRNGSGLDREAPLHWRHQQRYSGQNIMSLGIYAEILGRWVGDAAHVSCAGRVTVAERHDPESDQPRTADIPDDFRVAGALAAGASLGYHISVVCAGAPANGITLYGSRATLRWSLNDTALLQRHGEEPRPLDPDPGTDRGWCVEADFVDSVRNGTPVNLTSFADGVRYMRFVDACWRSWTEGGRVAIAGESDE